MPIEIKELHIRINVDDNKPDIQNRVAVDAKEINNLVKNQIEKAMYKKSCKKER